MSHFVPCTKCGLFTTAGMGADLSNLTCHYCVDDDEKFTSDQSIEKDDVVKGKLFSRGIVQYVGRENTVKIVESEYLESGDELSFDSYYLQPIE